MAKRSWSKDLDDTHYELQIEDGNVTICSYAPPEFHYRQPARCTIAEFVAGKISRDVQAYFGDAVLAEALAFARSA